VTAEEKTAGGIIIPDTAKEKPQEGEVIAIGSGTLNDKGELRPLDVKPGDRILFGKWSGTEVRLEGALLHGSAQWCPDPARHRRIALPLIPGCPPCHSS